MAKSNDARNIEQVADLSAPTEPFVFKGIKIASAVWRGRRAWVARHVGIALGYSNKGKRMVANITGDWAPELKLGEHYDVLAGTDLAEFKQLAAPGAASAPSRASAISILYEPGVHQVCLLSRKARGRELRRMLSSEVMPQLVRTGSYSPDVAVVNERAVQRDLKPENVSERSIELQMRQLQVEAISDALANLSQLGPSGRDTLLLWKVQAATGRNIAQLLPAADPSWEQPTQIAERNGVSPNHIGRIVTSLGLRAEKPGMARAIQNLADNGRMVVSWLYSPTAVTQIESELQRLRVVGGRR